MNISPADSVEMIKNFFNAKVIKITDGKACSYCFLCGKNLGIYIDKEKALCSQCFEKISLQSDKLNRCQENKPSIKKPDKKQRKRQRMFKKDELNQLLLFKSPLKLKAL